INFKLEDSNAIASIGFTTQGIEFAESPTSVTLRRSDSLYWPCSAKPSPGEPDQSFTYSWAYYNASGIADSVQPSTYSNGTLYVESMSSDFAGRYKCSASGVTTGDVIKTDLVTLGYIDDAFITSPISATIAPSTTDYAFFCSVASYPAATIEWRYDDKPINDRDSDWATINTSEDELVVSTTLVLKYPTHARWGEYRCSATNDYLQVPLLSDIAELKISGSPGFKISPQTSDVNEGSTAMFRCVGKGMTEPDQYWAFKPDGSATYSEIYPNDPNNMTYLYVHNVTSDDVGSYRCSINNTDGERNAEANLTLVAYAPVLEDPIVNQFANLRDAITLTCSIRGAPLPEAVVWSKVNGDLPDESSTVIKSQFNWPDRVIGTLKINYVMEEDQGIYTCSSSNSEGSFTENVTLSVYETPVFSTAPGNPVVQNGDEVNLPCRPTGNPAPKTQWRLKDGGFMDLGSETDHYQVFYNGTLRIKKASPNTHGGYVCFADNEKTERQGYISKVFVNYAPVFDDNQPSKLYPHQDQDAFVSCNVKSHPNPTIRWYRGESKLGPLGSPDYQVFPNGTLKIFNIQPRDDAPYYCDAQNREGEAERRVDVEVRAPPKIIFSPISQMVDDGGIAFLKCDVAGRPKPSIKWLFQDADLPRELGKLSSNMELSSGDLTSSLSVSNIRQEQLGKYTCVASNNAGTVTASAIVHTQDFPRFVVKPEDVKVDYGNAARLYCNGTVHINGTILAVDWFRDNGDWTYTPQPDNSSVGDVKLADGSLKLSSVDFGDRGRYVCRLSTNAASINASAYLQVNGKPILDSLTNEVEYAGNEIQLACPSTGDPYPTTTWTAPTGYEVMNNNPHYRQIGDNLLIHALSVERDFGRWTCKKCNSYGCAEDTLMMTIVGKPNITHSVGRDINPVNESSRRVARDVNPVNESSYLAISCPAVGFPSPSFDFWAKDLTGEDYSWIHPKYPPADHEIITTETPPQLRIFGGNKRDGYKCVAKNMYGSDIWDLTAPRAIAQPLPYTSTPNTATVDWVDPREKNLPIKHYNLNYRQGDGTWNSLNENVQSLPHTIDNLQPYTQYEYMVQPVNALGTGSFYHGSKVTTEAIAPSIPRNMECVIADNDGNITWNAPAELNGNPADIIYEVKYNDENVQNPTYKSKTTKDRSIRLDDVEHKHNYTVKVRAGNRDIGEWGPYTTACNLLAVPIVPRCAPTLKEAKVMGAHDVKLTWEDKCNTFKDGYRVCSKESVDTKDWQCTNYSNPQQRSQLVTGLDESTENSFVVAALNDAGHGPYSNELQAKTAYELYTWMGDGYWTGGRIAGLVIGLVAALFLILLLLFCCCNRGGGPKVEKRGGLNIDGDVDGDVEAGVDGDVAVKSGGFCSCCVCCKPKDQGVRVDRSGEVNLAMDDIDADANANVKVEGDVKAPRVRVQNEYAVPNVKVGERAIDVDLNAGDVKVKGPDVDVGDINIQKEADIKLNKPNIDVDYDYDVKAP
ncbi:unnamed protein product, partial [Owenia fusiformis]